MVNISDTSEVLVSEGEVMPNDPTARVHFEVMMHPEAFRDLAELARLSNASLDTIIAKAFALYRMSAEANRKGKAVGIASTADVLETEFVGF